LKPASIPFTTTGHRIVRMQAFVMRRAQPEIGDALVGIERTLHAPRGVLAEHQVLSVRERERLFVLALDGGLHRRLERVLRSGR
jgi:hypothetical protein